MHKHVQTVMHTYINTSNVEVFEIVVYQHVYLHTHTHTNNGASTCIRKRSTQTATHIPQTLRYVKSSLISTSTYKHKHIQTAIHSYINTSNVEVFEIVVDQHVNKHTQTRTDGNAYLRKYCNNCGLLNCLPLARLLTYANAY
jgi:hypothetical protein